MIQDEFRYWAFISYSHADERWASWLHKGLERYRIPARLVGQETPQGQVPSRLFPVFRDRDELAGSSELGPELQKALRSSRAQIVICSRNAVRSHWVNEEIKFFKSLRPGQCVLALIVDGEPHAAGKGQPEQECFPEALRFKVNAAGQLMAEAAEPIAADARPVGDGKLNALLKLIAGLLGVGFDDLKQRDLQARNRRLAFVAGLAVSVSAITIVLAVLAYQARNDALRRQNQAEDLIQFMLGDLREKLEPIGKLSILDAVGDKAMDYFASLDESDRTDAVLASRAKALRQIGMVRIKQGEMARATPVLSQAIELYQELAARHPQDTELLLNAGESQMAIGYAHYVKGESAQAQPWWQQYLATAQKLVQLDPQNLKWQDQVVQASTNLGAIAYGLGDLDRAESDFVNAFAVQNQVVERQPDNAEAINILSVVQSWRARIAIDRLEWEAALQHVSEQASLLKKALQLSPDNAAYRLRLINAQLRQVFCEAQLKRIGPEHPVLIEALRAAEAQVQRDADNLDYGNTLLTAWGALGQAELMAGQIQDADVTASKALTYARSRHEKAPDNIYALNDYLKGLTRKLKTAWLLKDAASMSTVLAEVTGLDARRMQGRDAVQLAWLDAQLMVWRLSPSTEQRQNAAVLATGIVEKTAPGLLQAEPELLTRYYHLADQQREMDTAYARLNQTQKTSPVLEKFLSQGA